MKSYQHIKDPNAPVLRIEDCLVSLEERKQILEWIECHRDDFLELESGRNVLVVNYQEDTPQIIWDIQQRILQQMGLHEVSTEAPLMRTFIEVMYPGCMAQVHRSAPVSNMLFFDVNVLLQKPDAGGDPILGDTLLLVKEGCAWKNYETLIQNSNTEVVGQKPRIVLTFTRSIPRRYFPVLFARSSQSA